jgi:DNA-directed RNA polymerase subunit RPC12/RpoP
MTDDRYGIGTTPDVRDKDGKVLIVGGTPRIIDRYPERLIRQEPKVKCATCGGTGQATTSSVQPDPDCPRCGGSGLVTRSGSRR